MNESLLLDTLKGRKTSRPPVWFMRQAGRVLPSYLALRSRHSFWELMADPILAAQVTLLPVHDLGVDAAILFSDILVIPYAMGMGLEFTDQGPRFDKPLLSYDDPMTALKPDSSRLEYIYRAIDEIVKTRPAGTPLIGFAGAPLTVMCYMLEGLSSKSNFLQAVTYLYANRKTAERLTSLITDLTIEYLENQVKHGIDVFQLFETHGGILPFEMYRTLFFPAIQKIARAARERGVPFIYFPKDIGAGYKSITPDVCDFVSIDWQSSIEEARNMVHPAVGLQGNLDPRILFADKESIEAELQHFIPFGRQNHNWIFNLGHGFIQGTHVDNARFVVDWVKNQTWRMGDE
jgi:uroporphyrinogen decarboxylase